MNSIKKVLLLIISLVPITLYAVKEPVPYPAGKAMPGGEPPDKKPLSDILTYGGFDKYSQPKWMDSFVQKGVIPPVKDRLPKEPQVFLTKGMRHGCGNYGGHFRYFSASPTAGHNLYAGVRNGWWGITYVYLEALVKSGTIPRRSDEAIPMPNLAKSWQWSADGYELTMKLIEGAKWSDGDPFDSEDVMFTWEDNILDPNVNSWKDRKAWQLDGKDINLVALDKYTIKFTFPKKKPVAFLFNMDYLDFSIAPSHWLKPFHPRYNSNSDYDAYKNAMPPNDLPVPSMGPWVMVVYKTDELLVARRNPYYWKVDQCGQQLPYLNEFSWVKGNQGTGRTLGALADKFDQSNVENPSVFIETVKRSRDKNSHFIVEWGPELLSFPLILNLSSTHGVKNTRDKEIRKLFRNFKFRRALSHALNRKAIAQSVVKGPFLRPFAGGLTPGSLYFDEDSVVFYDYDPPSSKQLLDELGLKDTNGNGVREWTSGPMKGKELVFELMTSTGAIATQHVADTVLFLLSDVGIKVNPRPAPDSSVKTDSGEFEMWIDRSGQEYAVPYAKYTDLAALQVNTPEWHKKGSKGRELMPFEKKLVSIVKEFSMEPDFNKRKLLMYKYNNIYTRNLYLIGTVVGRYGQIAHKRLKNWVAGTPVFMYQWAPNSAQPDQMWVEKGEQKPEILPNTIPIYTNK